MKKLRAVPGKVIIRLPEEPRVTKGGIHIPETVKNSEDRKALQGIVVSLSVHLPKPGTIIPLKDLKDIPTLEQYPGFGEGDSVLFEQWEGDELIDDDGTKYRVVAIKHVLAVLE